MVVWLRCLLHHILSLNAYTFCENREFVFIIIVQFMMSANSGIRFALQIVPICLYSTPSHYHHCANLSEDNEHIKCLSDIFLSSVWVRLSIFAQLSIIQSITQYAGLCDFSLATDNWENIYTLSYYRHQIGSMNYYPLFRVRSWNNGVRCMYFYILIALFCNSRSPWGRRIEKDSKKSVGVSFKSWGRWLHQRLSSYWFIYL